MGTKNRAKRSSVSKIFRGWGRRQSIILFAVLFAVVGILALIAAHAATSSIYFSPNAISKDNGQTFSIAVRVNPGGTSSDSARAFVQYDPAKLQFLSVDCSNSLYKY